MVTVHPNYIIGVEAAFSIRILLQQNSLKHVRMDEVKTAVVTEMQDVKSKTDIIAGHIERDKGHIPIQLQQLQALNQEIEALIKSRKTKAVIPNAKT